jgi:hypothetical protein
VVHETGKYPGMRAWAAQWRKVDFKLLPAHTGEGVKQDELPLNLNPPKVAAITLRDVTAGNETADDFGDEYWDAFLDAIE